MNQIAMRDQMVLTIQDLFERDERLVLLLAEITRTAFEPLAQRFPRRVINLGIMEQALISIAAGMALEGFIPVVHTIAPFLVERPFEQLKLDFLYQGLAGNFIGVGGSHDYSTSGMTHHAAGDLLALRSLPGMQLVVPGTAAEFDRLFRASYDNGAATYFRLSVPTNPDSYQVAFGELLPLRRGQDLTVIAVGPTLPKVLAAVADLDLTLLYCTTITPFDRKGLRAMCNGNAIVTVEPGYSGALLPDITATFQDQPMRIATIGLTQQILHQYGTIEQLDQALGLTETAIRQTIVKIVNRQHG